MKDLISVIVPVYKTEKYLERCIKSIQKQTYSNLEIILIDDGSPDRCPEMCERFEKEDVRIRVIHKKNGGVSSVRNRGMKEARGSYITFVDSDDYLMDETVYERTVQNMIQYSADIGAFMWQFENTVGEYVVKRENIPLDFDGVKTTSEFAKYLYQGSYANGLVVSVWNKVYCRSFIEDINFDESMIICEDDEWVNRIYSKKGTVCCDDSFGYVYAQNNDSLTHLSFRKEKFVLLDILRKRIDVFNNHSFIILETQKCYLNLYIEYYYRAKDADIQAYEDRVIYTRFRKAVRDVVSMKTRFRFWLFGISPKVYKRLVYCKLGRLHV